MNIIVCLKQVPDTESQIQLCRLASAGHHRPRCRYPKTARKTVAMATRRKLTFNDPMRFPAASKASMVAVQDRAVSRAAMATFLARALGLYAPFGAGF